MIMLVMEHRNLHYLKQRSSNTITYKFSNKVKFYSWKTVHTLKGYVLKYMEEIIKVDLITE